MSRKTLILAVVGLVFGSLYSSAVEAHWCSNIFGAHSRFVIKPEKTTVVVSGSTQLRVYLQNNFPYRLFNVRLRGVASGYTITASPTQQNIHPGQNVSYVLTINGNGTLSTTSTLSLQMAFRLSSSTWRADGVSSYYRVYQNPSQSALIGASAYGSSQGQQSPSLNAAYLGDKFSSATLGTGAAWSNRDTGLKQNIHWFGYRYCYSSSGYFRCGSSTCPSSGCPEGSTWTSIAQFPQNCMRAGIDVGVRRSTLGSQLTYARNAAVNAMAGSGSNDHRCLAAVVGGYLWQNASSKTAFTTALNASSMPTTCKNAGLRVLNGSPTSSCTSGAYYERAACAAAEGLRNNNGPVTSVLMANAGDGNSSGSYTSLYYAYMLYLVQGHRRATTGYVPFYPDAGAAGCSTAGDCNDNNACTTDSCSAGACTNTAISGCCTSASQCGDSNPCTADTCVSNACVYTPISSCCTSASQCNDSNVCTSDSCTSNSCQNTAISGCCTSASQCNDSNACTTDTCSSNACVFTPVSGCCTTAAQCNDNNACTTDTCSSNSCQNTTISGCCTSNSQCNDSNVCTSDVCSSNSCQNSAISGCCTAASQCTDGNACTTDTCVSNACVFTPTAGCCTTNANCTDSNPCTTDTCNTSTGTCSNVTQSGCCAVDTECADTNVCTSDKCVSNACQNTAISGCCTTASQCSDSNACTTDTCVSNACQHATVANCCTTAAQCNDNNACTTDTCSANKCGNAAVSGCCTSNSQCDDKNACTTNTCTANKCVYTPTAGCCTKDTDCADNDSCTVDACDTSSGTCSNTKTSGCCSYDTDCDDSNSCTLDTCDTTTNTCSHASILCGDAGPGDASSSDINTSADAAAGADKGTGNPADVNSLEGGCALGGGQTAALPLSLLALLGVWLLGRRRRRRR